MADLWGLSESLEQIMILVGIGLAFLTPLWDVGGALALGGLGLMWSKGEIG